MKAPRRIVGFVAAALGLLAGSSLIGQADTPVRGIVTSDTGQPVAGVTVYGSLSKTCCPFKREHVTTDEGGRFRLEHPGQVIHFSKDKLQPKALAVGSATSEIQVVLQPSKDSLTVVNCEAVGRGQTRIGWGKYGLQFNVPKHEVRILRGKTDVDYIRHVVRSVKSEAFLEFWFGGNAMGLDPGDDEFVNSASFDQRNVIAADRGLMGLDSWGKLASGKQWRQTAILGQGGARYKDAAPEDARLFDQIINSICFIPYPER